MRTLRAISCIGLLMLLGAPSQAIVIASLETDIAPPDVYDQSYTPTFFSGGPSAIDIINGTLPVSSVGNFNHESAGGLPALTNGSIEIDFPSARDVLIESYATAGQGNSITYSLSTFYDIGAIVVYGGWLDAGRDAQHYTISTSQNGINFTPLVTYSNGYGEEQGTINVPISHRVEFTDNTNPELASNVAFVRFDFHAVENGYTGYTEIDIFGQNGPVPLAGDLNFDGLVDLNDFYYLADRFMTVPPAVGEGGDVNYDGFVDEQDFRLWKDLVGPYISSLPSSITQSVPEPSSLLLLVGIACGMSQQRRTAVNA